nr:MAG TPA: hypothetical protein [Caudoviricetes sp.]
MTKTLKYILKTNCLKRYDNCHIALLSLKFYKLQQYSMN